MSGEIRAEIGSRSESGFNPMMQSRLPDAEGQKRFSAEVQPSVTAFRENRELASEVKFRVPLSQAEGIRDWARRRLSADPHAAGESGDQYHLCSLYFDTEQLDVFRRNASFGRSKYRIRRYLSNSIAFLERKLKTGEVVCKRRSPVGLSELGRLTEAEAVPGWPGFWYHQRLLVRQLGPVCQIAYERTALVGAGRHGPMRLTVDQTIRAQPVQGLSFVESSGGQLVSDGYAIVELKYRREMPVLFKELVEQFGLNPTKISKYRLAMVGLGIACDDGEIRKTDGGKENADARR
jgi:hypothetical protein